MKNLFVFVFVIALVAGAIITSAAIYEHKIVFYSIIGVVSLHYIVYNTIWWGKDELDDYVDSHLFMTLLRHLLVVVLLNGFVLLVLQLNQ
jgi:hypothetical protein